ncbi:MAG: glutaconyl-CoA decarboxylase subunit alpha, partial [Desulfobacteraceae bacterium]|nr:glutaconyl-CoA decarboxylase subunit alpha [Desulfobacteraceae bacterium]
MRQYFEKMTEFGSELNKGKMLSSEKNMEQVRGVEAGIEVEVEKVKNAGMPTEKINSRGVMTVWQRL